MVTSVTPPDHQKEAELSTMMKPIEMTEHVNMDAKMPVMPQLALVTNHLLIFKLRKKQKTPSQRINARAPSKAKPGKKAHHNADGSAAAELLR